MAEGSASTVIVSGPVAEGLVVAVVGLLGGRPVGPAAEAAVRAAVLVAGGVDQLAGIADLVAPGARTVVVGAGLGALDEVAASAGPACVLASGDPGCFGILRPLAARLGTDRVAVHPAPSSVALAFARLGLAWDGAVVRSCHRGGAARVAAEVAGAVVAAVLCGPEAPPQAVGAALVTLGASHRLVAVATRLGEPGEQVLRCADLAALAAGRFDPRSVVVLAQPGSAEVAPWVRTGGRPVEEFAHRASMITKPEVRSVVLGKLDVPAAGVLWDVGAGSGSVAVEAALAAPGLRVIAVERRADDAARVLANAAAVGAVVEVVEGAAPAALAGLPAPDRIFVGGGGLDVLDACLAALRPGGRVVATFAAVDRAADAHRRLGSLVQVAVSRAEALPDGGVRLAADNPVFVAWGDRPSQAAPAPGRLAVGIGCSSTATAEEVAAAVAEALAAARHAGSGPSEEPAGDRPSQAAPAPGRLAVGIGCSSTATAEEVAGAVAEAPAARHAESAPSEEPGGHGPGVASSEEPEGSIPTGPGTLRQDPGDGPPVPQRGGPAAAPAAGVRSRHGEDHDDRDVVIATIDRRHTHPAVVAAAAGRRLVSFPSSLLGVVDVPDPSDVVEAAVGTPSVAEAAALLAAGPGARLVVGKLRRGTVTASVAIGDRSQGGANPPSTAAAATSSPPSTEAAAAASHRLAAVTGDPQAMAGRVQIVGLGPGHPQHRTPAATAAVRGADAVVGYGPYVDTVLPLLRPEQLVVRSAMGAEAERALIALALARSGWRVALVSSGDPGVFAMASVTLELAAEAAAASAAEGLERPLGAEGENPAADGGGRPLVGAEGGRPDPGTVREERGPEPDGAAPGRGGHVPSPLGGGRTPPSGEGEGGAPRRRWGADQPIDAGDARLGQIAAVAPAGADVVIEVVPGITASSAAAAAVGAPLAGPHAVLTLSDLLVPWASIETQLRAAASSGLALALYNPRSAGRPDHLDRARQVLIELLDPATPVAVVTAATEAAEQAVVTTLGDLDAAIAGMRSLVIVGTTDTACHGDRLVTRRHHPRPEAAR
ncbi:MAG: precorrin-6y C5,15-methyltransferase (decarboxylating) subunit CbiE [Acidimicrobiales bacterium]